MHPALVTEVSKEEFDGMAKVLKKLGPIKSKTMTAIRVNAGAPTEGDYNLEFAARDGAFDQRVPSAHATMA